MRNCVAWFFLATATVHAGCVTQRVLVSKPSSANPDALAADAAQIKRVQEATAQRRHLPFLRDVPVDVMNAKQLRAWFGRYTQQHKGALAREDRFHHRMGILRPTVSTAEAFSGFLVDFVGGVYDDDEQRMILVSDYAWWSKLQQDIAGYVTGEDWAYRLFLTHELTHALQDQHFGLGDMLKGGVYDKNDDAAFVRKTLLESEANVMGMSDFLGMDLDQLATRKLFFLFLRYNNLLNGPVLALLSGDAPSFFAKQTFSQYELGLSYVEHRLDDGGPNALSRSYLKRPGDVGAMPESTEQLLWPRKSRPATLDPPIHFAPLLALPDAVGALVPSHSNVFGALAFKHWGEGFVSRWDASAVADGWGGDRYDVVMDGDSPVLLWRTSWDTERDATEALALFEASAHVRYGERLHAIVDSPTRYRAQITAAPQEKLLVRSLRDEVVWLERRGKDLVIVDGATVGTAQLLMDALWQQMTPVARAPLNDAVLAQKNRALNDAIADTLARDERPGLLGRFFLPARTMALRVGAGVNIDRALLSDTEALVRPIDAAITPVTDVEMRWGFRQHFELSSPLGLSVSVPTPFGLTVAGASASGFAPLPSFTLAAMHLLPLGSALVLAAQAQLRTKPFGPSEPVQTRWALGASLQPVSWLVLSPGVAVTTQRALLQGAPDGAVILGAALSRGFMPAPLVEIEVVDGLYVYESTALLLKRTPGGVAWVGDSHVLGLAIYF